MNIIQREHKSWRRWLLGICLLGCVSCSESSTTRLSALNPDSVILAFGDSLTQGTGAALAESYPTHLADLSGFKVLNAGIAGEVSAAGLKRLPALLARHQPSLVLLCHGGNDLLRKLSIKQLSKNLEQMISLIDGTGAETVLIGVPKPGLLLGTAPIYTKIAEKHNLVSNLQVMTETLSDAGLKSDPVHPNARGYREIAQSIHGTLTHAGAY